jgi:hypothetical protein
METHTVSHQARRRRLELFAQLLAMPCDWPNCGCAQDYRKYKAAVAEMNDPAKPCPTEAEVDAVLVHAQPVMACMSHRCSDKHVRTSALIDMLHPVWNDADDAMQRLLDADDAEEAKAPPKTVFNIEPTAFPEPTRLLGNKANVDQASAHDFMRSNTISTRKDH